MVHAKLGEERIFTFNLRQAFEKGPRYKRTKKAINKLRSLVVRHMKCENVAIGHQLNSKLWEHGNRNPPSKIKVKAMKEQVEKEKGKPIEVVHVDMVDVQFKQEEPKKQPKKVIEAKQEEPNKEITADQTKDLKTKQPTQ